MKARVPMFRRSYETRLTRMYRRLAFDNLVLVTQYAVVGLVPLLLVPHIVRELGLGQFGSLAVALAWANYGVVIVQFAFHYTGPRQLAQLAAGDTESTVVCRVAGAKLVLFMLVLSLFGLSAVFAEAEGAGLSLAQIMVLVCLPAAGVMHTGWHLQAAGHFLMVAAVSVFSALAALLVGFGLVWADNPNALLAAALALTIGPLVSGLGTLLASVKLLARKKPWAAWQSPWRELREGWPLFASQFTAALYSASGPIIVGMLAGMEQAGAFSAVERVINAIAGACLLTHTAAYPKLARLYQTDRRAYLRLVGVVICTYLAAAAGVAAAVFVFWQTSLQFLFGAQSGGQDLLVAAALAWLVLGVFGTVFTGYLTVSGNSGAVLPLTLRILLVALCLGIPGVIALGAWAWMAALAVSQVLVLVSGWSAWNTEVRRSARITV